MQTLALTRTEQELYDAVVAAGPLGMTVPEIVRQMEWDFVNTTLLRTSQKLRGLVLAGVLRQARQKRGGVSPFVAVGGEVEADAAPRARLHALQQKMEGLLHAWQTAEEAGDQRDEVRCRLRFEQLEIEERTLLAIVRQEGWQRR